MRLSVLRAATATGLAAVVLLATSGSAAVVQEDAKLFLRQNGCGTAQEAGRLSLESGAPNKDLNDGCGTIGGIPLAEAFRTATGENLPPVTFTTGAGDGVPLILDAAKDVVGQISTRTWTGTPGGVGEVVVDLELTGTFKNAKGQNRSETLGAGTFTAMAAPTATFHAVPFRFDVPDAFQGVTFNELVLSVATRGANLNASARALNGRSFLTVPTLVTETE
jgi:hypothetical protein